jgi:hypothetical protein
MSASLKQDHLKLPNESQPLLAAKRAISVEQDDESLELQNNESIKDDIVDILRLAFPIFLSSLSWVGVSGMMNAKGILLTIVSESRSHTTIH